MLKCKFDPSKKCGFYGYLVYLTFLSLNKINEVVHNLCRHNENHFILLIKTLNSHS